MDIIRRNLILGVLGLGAASSSVLGYVAGATARVAVSESATNLHVMGVIHSNHRTSESYSLGVLERAIRKAKPDVILTEIPPDRVGQAIRSFRETGEVNEPRTRVFPEYTDVVFPLSRDMGFRIMGTAGWTRRIADNRSAVLDRIRSDPSRRAQWSEHRAAQSEFSRLVAGRGDDPLFIHTEEFDRLVEASRDPYERYFDADLGPGGWTQINSAHTANINSALDMLSGKGLNVLVTYGSAHKYKILRSVSHRDDVQIMDTRSLFT